MNKHTTDDSATGNSPGVRTSLLRYHLILLVLLPLVVGFTVYQSIRYRSLTYLLQRLGIIIGYPGNTDVWIHAASVGEVNAAIPLIKTIQKHEPSKIILVSTTTPTGARVIQSKRDTGIRHCYLPLDYPAFVLAFLKSINPKCAIIMETEIWPNLFRLCREKNIVLNMVNARLSQRTLNTRRWIKSLYASALQYPSLILTRSDNDSKAYIALGAPGDRIKTIGNIKFAADINKPSTQVSFTQNPYLLAASTHDDEELQLATLWKNNRQAFSNYLLVIAPRHPQRLSKIIKQLNSLNLVIAVRSRNNPVTAQTDIYIVDTVGELAAFMKNAQLVFMGGSLVPIGGHNVIEPASLARPVIFGPHMENFENEAQLLLNHQAAIQIQDIPQLLATLNDLIRNEVKRNQLGDKARKLVETQKDVAERYYAELQLCLNKKP